jgi:hypothetical protein
MERWVTGGNHPASLTNSQFRTQELISTPIDQLWHYRSAAPLQDHRFATISCDAAWFRGRGFSVTAGHGIQRCPQWMGDEGQAAKARQFCRRRSTAEGKTLYLRFGVRQRKNESRHWPSDVVVSSLFGLEPDEKPGEFRGETGLSAPGNGSRTLSFANTPSIPMSANCSGNASLRVLQAQHG